MATSFGPFTVEISDGIGHIVFDRPPVNAFALNTYAALGEIIDFVEQRDDIKVVVLSGSPSVRSWCGGADLNDFVGLDREGRHERYAFINETVPRFAALNRPVIAAITGHTIGIGVMLAACCDLRIASDTALFSTPGDRLRTDCRIFTTTQPPRVARSPHPRNGLHGQPLHGGRDEGFRFSQRCRGCG